MVMVVVFAKSLHLLHVVTKAHTSFFMIGCNVVAQLHIQIERQVKTLIDFEDKTKTKIGISKKQKQKHKQKHKKTLKHKGKGKSKARHAPRQGKP
jgi:hypothetical protein